MYRYLISMLLGTAICSSCADGESSQTNNARPVKSIVAKSSKYIIRDFVGLSTPERAVNLAFKISGQIDDIPVVKGQLVEEGELLCGIDPRDVELQLASDKSNYEQALSRYERAKRLLEHDAISEQEVESSRSSYISAKSSYDNRRELLQETTLQAPFRAVIERVYIDVYQRVQAGEMVMRIVAPQTRNVEFTLPESALSAMKQPTTRFEVTFNNIPSMRFPAKVIEFARTTSDASGFPVTVAIEKLMPESFIISSGMSCTISMISEQQDKGAVTLPLSAIYSPISGGNYVWVIGEDNRVEQRRVTLEEPSQKSSVVVSTGVKSGDRVVSAGVYQLRDNQRVTIIKYCCPVNPDNSTTIRLRSIPMYISDGFSI